MNNNIDRCIAVMDPGSEGGRMADTLHRDGWDVPGFDPSEAARADSSGTGIATTANIQELVRTPYVLSSRSAKIVESTMPQLLAASGTVAVPPVPGVFNEYRQMKAIWVRIRAAVAPFASMSC